MNPISSKTQLIKQQILNKYQNNGYQLISDLGMVCYLKYEDIITAILIEDEKTPFSLSDDTVILGLLKQTPAHLWVYFSHHHNLELHQRLEEHSIMVVSLNDEVLRD